MTPIVRTKIAVSDACVSAVRWQVSTEPIDEPVHRRNPPTVEILEILLRPAPDLAFDEAGRTPVIAEADLVRHEAVHLRDRRVHRVEVSGAGFTAEAREMCFPDDPSRHHVHDEEGSADDLVVLAQTMDRGHREALAG